MSTLASKSSGIQTTQNAHPGIDLARAISRLEGLKERAGDQDMFTRGELVSKLKFAPTSGGANVVISALQRFGFLRKLENNDFTYTDFGTKFLATRPEDKGYDELLRDALRTPELYNWLDSKYGEQLPEEITDILIGKYHDRNVRKDNVKAIINNYLKSVAFAKGAFRPTPRRHELDEYALVSLGDGTKLPIYKRYLLEAIEKTHNDELAKINNSLN